MTWAMRAQFTDRQRGPMDFLVEYPFHCWSCGRPDFYGERLDCWKCERMLDRAYRSRDARQLTAALNEFQRLCNKWFLSVPIRRLGVAGAVRRELESVNPVQPRP